jgi:hypothetical protein
MFGLNDFKIENLLGNYHKISRINDYLFKVLSNNIWKEISQI